MIHIFELTQYREILLSELKSRGTKGRVSDLALFLKVHPTRLSQILRSHVNLTPEQALSCAEFFGWGKSERDYFLQRVLEERAGTKGLREYHGREAEQIRRSAVDLSKALPQGEELSEAERALFYSSWRYVAISLLSDISGKRTIPALAQHFGISLPETRRIVEFLLASGINRMNSEGEIVLGKQRTHLESASPLVPRHHANWRLKALERHESLDPSLEMAYSGPMVLSEKACEEIRRCLVETIRRSTQIAVDSPSEKLMVLNLDWVEVR